MRTVAQLYPWSAPRTATENIIMTSGKGTSSPAAGDRPPHPTELAFIRDARIGHLATIDGRGRPSVVPFCFAVLGNGDPAVASVLDDKPKRLDDRRLARVRNISQRPGVSFVVDEYHEDWSRLAFVQIHGAASLMEPASEGHGEAIAALRVKYPQYRTMAIERRLVIIIRELRAYSWRGDGRPFTPTLATGGPENAGFPV